MNFDPTYTLESVSCPGVVVTLNRMGPKRRAATELKVSESRAKYRAFIQTAEKINIKLQAMLDAIPEYRAKVAALPHKEDGSLVDDLPAELVAMVPADAWILSAEKTAAESQAASVGRAEIHPAFVLAAVQGISGLTSGDTSYTAEMLCEYGPDELFDEVVKAINESAYISKERAGNLSLPTTSGAQAGGGLKSTTASTAN